MTGTVSTAILAARGGIRAGRLLDDFEQYHVRVEADDTLQERFKLVWKEFIPAAGVGVLTISAIVFSNRISTSRAAALAAAYSITDQAFTDYKRKVIEKIGETKEEAVRAEIAQERVEKVPTSTLVLTEGKVLCYDLYTDRFFESTVENIKKAQNDLNYEMINGDGYASLSNFYEKIGLSPTSMSEEVGWCSDKQLEVNFTTVMSPDQKPAIAIDFMVRPKREYWKFNR